MHDRKMLKYQIVSRISSTIVFPSWQQVVFDWLDKAQKHVIAGVFSCHSQHKTWLDGTASLAHARPQW